VLIEDLILFLDLRVQALDSLIKIHNSQTGDYLVMERAVCLIQLDLLKVELGRRLSSKVKPIT
jgi:hypothetical protein